VVDHGEKVKMKQGSSSSSSEQSDMLYDDAPVPNRIILGCLLNGLSTPKWQLAVAMAAPLLVQGQEGQGA